MSARREPGPVAARPMAGAPEGGRRPPAERAAQGRLRRAAGAAPRGVLMVLALLMASSAATRLGFGTGLEPVRAAVAQGVAASGRAIEEALSDDPAAEDGVDAAPVPAAAPVSPGDARGIEALIAALAERDADLDAREAALAERTSAEERRLAERQAQLAQAKDELQAMMAEVEAAEARLDAAIARASGAAEDDLARLTSVYESMKPKDAAALFETMEPAFAAGFLGRMRAEAAAEVMSGMSPERAYAVSAIIAGRNAALDAPGDGAGASPRPGPKIESAP